MSSLTDTEKRYLERVLGMGDGYVLDFTDATFGEFFERHNVDIYGHKYQTLGTSKAKTICAFWTSESDRRVGTVLSDMLDSYESDCDVNGRGLDRRLLEKVRSVAGRLTVRSAVSHFATTEVEFLAREFRVPNIQKIPIDGTSDSARQGS